MEQILTIIISVLTAVGGWEAIRYFLNRRAEKRKAEAEAESAETAATKEVQDVYQQLIADVKADREEQRQYIMELKEDRKHLREERNELLARIDKTDDTVRQLQRDVSRNGRMVESMRPFMCGRVRCPNRISVTISDAGVVNADNDNELDPIDNSVL